MKIVARRQVTENQLQDVQVQNYQQPQQVYSNPQQNYANSQQPYIAPNPPKMADNNNYTNDGNIIQNNPSKAAIPPIDNKPRRTGWAYEYLLDNGQVITTEQAYDMAMQGLLENIQCSTNKGVKYVRSMPDGNPDNDLQDLPTF